MFEEDTDALFNVFGGEGVQDQFDDVMDDLSDDEPNLKRAVSPGQEALDRTKKQKLEQEGEIEKFADDLAHQIQPIVADTFEEETSREVANIAGLQSAPNTEGTQITLSHQVCCLKRREKQY
jgi:ATP-dependent RNA helicase DOB1